MELIVICGGLAGPRSAWAAILRIAAQAALRVRLQPRLWRSAIVIMLRPFGPQSA